MTIVSYRDAIRTAYADALGLLVDEITETIGLAAEAALVAHAADDEEAAAQIGAEESEVTHDRVTLVASDRLPLILVGRCPGVAGRFYFARPIGGWPRP